MKTNWKKLLVLTIFLTGVKCNQTTVHRYEKEIVEKSCNDMKLAELETKQIVHNNDERNKKIFGIQRYLDNWFCSKKKEDIIKNLKTSYNLLSIIKIAKNSNFYTIDMHLSFKDKVKLDPEKFTLVEKDSFYIGKCRIDNKEELIKIYESCESILFDVDDETFKDLRSHYRGDKREGPFGWAKQLYTSGKNIINPDGCSGTFSIQNQVFMKERGLTDKDFKPMPEGGLHNYKE